MEKAEPRVVETSSSDEFREHSPGNNTTSNGLGLKDLLLPCLIIVLPMAALIVLLLYFVLHYQLDPPSFANPELAVPFNETSTSHYYVNFSTSKIATIASKLATCAGIAISSALLLLSFPIARRIHADSVHDRQGRLPTPYQLTLLLAILNGGLGSLVKYVKYRFTWGKEGGAVPGFMFVSVLVLAALIGLQYLMLGMEVWLSSVMQTVSYLQVSQLSNPTYDGGRGFSEWCLENSARETGGSPQRQCTAYYQTNLGRAYINNASEAYSTLWNTSTTNRLWMTKENLLAILPQTVPEETDYSAHTFGITTECTPITASCRPDFQGSYNCAGSEFDLIGAMDPTSKSLWDHSPMRLQFTDLSVSGDPSCQDYDCWNQTNTALRGHFALAFSFGLDYPKWSSLLDQGDQRIHPLGGQLANYMVLGCNYYGWDVMYNWAGGLLTNVEPSSMNLSSFYNFNYPMQQNLTEDYFKTQMLAAIAKSSTPQDIANDFAAIVSQGFLGLGAGALSNRTATAQQTRTTILAAKIPKPLFWVNIALPLLFAAAGLSLAVVAVVGKTPDGCRDVRDRLSVAGIVAQRYVPTSPDDKHKDLEEVFKENELNGETRILAMRSGHGTWELKPSHDLQ